MHVKIQYWFFIVVVLVLVGCGPNTISANHKVTSLSGEKVALGELSQPDSYDAQAIEVASYSQKSADPRIGQALSGRWAMRDSFRAERGDTLECIFDVDGTFVLTGTSEHKPFRASGRYTVNGDNAILRPDEDSVRGDPQSWQIRGPIAFSGDNSFLIGPNWRLYYVGQ